MSVTAMFRQLSLTVVYLACRIKPSRRRVQILVESEKNADFTSLGIHTERWPVRARSAGIILENLDWHNNFGRGWRNEVVVALLGTLKEKLPMLLCHEAADQIGFRATILS